MDSKNYFRDEKGKLIVNVSTDILKKYCLWTIAKYKNDPYHKQQNSSRSDLLGGFLDRWLNRIPEFLIFNALIDENKINNDDFKLYTVNDNFIYNQESAKNAPDIIGLIKQYTNGKKEYYGFSTFNTNQWYGKSDAPFIEMKTFRKSQKLITVPENQFDESHYYAIVSSDIKDDYLLYLLDENIFKMKYNFESTDKFINQNDAKILKKPNDIIENVISDFKVQQNYVGTYKLLGIYDGKTINDFSIVAGTLDDEPEKPRYLSSIEEIKDKNVLEISSGIFEYFTDQVDCVSILIDIDNQSKLSLLSIAEDYIVLLISGKSRLISVDGLFDEILEDGCYKLNFKYKIINLVKYFYPDSIKKLKFDSINDNLLDEEINSGIFNYYGNDYKNNKFNLNQLINENFKILDYSKSSLTFSIKTDDKIVKKIKYSFNDKGELKKDDIEKEVIHLNEANVKKEALLEDFENYSLFLKLFAHDNSTLKFIKKTKKKFLIFIEGTATISDSNFDNEFDICDGFYEFKIYDGTERRNNPSFDLRKPEIIKKPKCPSLKVDDYGFYYPDKFNENFKNVNNVKFKVDCSKGSIEVIEVKKSNKHKYETYYKIMVDGTVIIDGEKLEDNSKLYKKIWKLNFDNFVRTSKKTEHILSKGSISYDNKLSLEKILLNNFIEFINDTDNILE